MPLARLPEVERRQVEAEDPRGVDERVHSSAGRVHRPSSGPAGAVRAPPGAVSASAASRRAGEAPTRRVAWLRLQASRSTASTWSASASAFCARTVQRVMPAVTLGSPSRSPPIQEPKRGRGGGGGQRDLPRRVEARAQGPRGPPEVLLGLVQRVARLLPEDLAEEGAEEPDVAPERGFVIHRDPLRKHGNLSASRP